MRRPRLLSEVSHCIRTVERLNWLIRLNITPRTEYIMRIFVRDGILLGSCDSIKGARSHTLTHVCGNLDHLREFMSTIEILSYVMSKGSL